MDALTKRQLLDATEALHKKNDWVATKALWQPYVEQGDSEAQFRLAYYYLFCSFDEEPQTRAEMENLLRTAADRGHPEAVYWLSHLCEEGEIRDQLLRKAGELGSRDAQRDLGVLYATGDWTGPKDLVRAAEWYRRAAERGQSDAQYNLGFMYLLGEGVRSDPQEALRWLRLAAAQGEEQAMRLLADLYRDGAHGFPVDPAQAAHWDEQYRVCQETLAKNIEDTD